MNFRPRAVALVLVTAFVSACSGGGGGGTAPVGRLPTAAPSTGTSPSPSPSSTAVSQAAFTCPTSDTATSSSRGGAVSTGDALTRRTNAGARAPIVTPGRLEVAYSLGEVATSRAALSARESALGTSLVGEHDYARLGLAMRVLSVPASQMTSAAAKLRAQSGVRSVTVQGLRIRKQTVSTPYFTNDPYFTGFSTTVPPTATSTAPPSTFEVAPYDETANVPGQWNMHAIQLEHAFGYSQTNNGSGITNAAALGSSGVKIAVIDVGEDTTQPELSSKIAYQKCFITNPTTNAQSISSFTTDEDGHGTDVAGIAAAATNNRFGFAGAGGNASIYAYRVQATPDDNCTNDSSTDEQCSTDTADIASAIDDAVAQNVNVITISLGGGSCTNGADSDPVEGAAIANAVAANIVVVAAAGNDGSAPLESPACDTGVIAAGATALADGQQTGASTTQGSASAPIEYVASYSDYGSPGAAVRSSSAWGIVAPGGDPVGDMDGDDLHWIEDIWTSTPYMSSSTDTSFEGTCAADYPGTGSTVDCRTLIAGTSMAAPTVAGAAALILAVAPTYQSPAKMKALLCTTADDIGAANEGCGRLNVYRAMATVLNDPTKP